MKNKCNPRKKYEYMSECKYHIKILSLNKNLHDCNYLHDALHEIIEDNDLVPIGYLDKNDRICDLGDVSYENIFPNDKRTILNIVFDKLNDIEIKVWWTGPLDLLPHSDKRVELWVKLGQRFDLKLASKLFMSAIHHFHPHWGELIEYAITKKYTFYGLNSGVPMSIPHLGMANYFGVEYVEFFGGESAFRNAGFSVIDNVFDGLYVEIPHVETNEDFLKVQNEIEAQLAPPEIFSDKIYGPTPILREWEEMGEVDSIDIETDSAELEKIFHSTPMIMKWDRVPNKDRIRVWLEEKEMKDKL